MTSQILPASFRDPNGFLFTREGMLYRQVNRKYAPHYDLLISSGLYAKLVEKNLLVPHVEADIEADIPELAYKVLLPEQLAFISYPYEWAFSQLKDAALLTLRIQKLALKYGMTLKDASAYNIQFQHGAPILIDTLSFETYQDGQPWVAYRQFCQHFLAPLALMSRRDVRLNQLLRIYIDGIPLDLASKLLPFTTRLNIGLLTHIHLHADLNRHAMNATRPTQPGGRMSKESLLALINHLMEVIKKLEWSPTGTAWANYYQMTNYTEQAFDEKKTIITRWLEETAPQSVWDLGANNGFFSRLAAERGIQTLSFDVDPAAVEQNYRQVKSNQEKNVLPLLLDLTNPSPALGWHNRERAAFLERGPAQMVFALALVHHLAIANNVPLARIATFLADVTSRWLIIEFVPKSDSQVQKLLASREDIFDTYNQPDFEKVFSQFFSIRQVIPVSQTERTLYLMERRDK